MALPLSAGRIIISVSFLRLFSADLSALVMFGLAGLANLRLLTTSLWSCAAVCWSRSTTCKTRPVGRVRPATLFCPAREMFLNYNGNRPSACHRPQLHYTIEGLSCLRLYRLKTNVITTFIFVDNALLNARWIVWILISNDIFVDRSFH